MLPMVAWSLVLAAAPEPGAREFCAEYTRISKTAPGFSEAVTATQAALPALSQATTPTPST